MKKVLKISGIIFISFTISALIIFSTLYIYKNASNSKEVVGEISETSKNDFLNIEERFQFTEFINSVKTTINQIIEEKEQKSKTIKISAVGDCTIGWDTNYIPEMRFDAYLDKDKKNYGYYFEKVKDIFSEDDLTIINLEGTFTSYTKKVPKEFNFSAPEEYKNVLKEGNVDAVSFANNHSYDYGKIGYDDTLKALESANMPYYSFDKYLVKEINGIKIGFFALSDISCKNYDDIDKALEYLKKENCELIIASMHWGVEGNYKQGTHQTKMGHYLIDNGVDLVLGSHPHRLQGIEKYKGRYIVYSMANFCFGGNPNPEDKDSMIFQQTFLIKDGQIQDNDDIKIIPASVSGVKDKNNYQPIVLEGKEKTRVLNKILRYSSGFEYNK